MANFNSVEDVDSIETQEWLDALQSIKKYDGIERVNFLLNKYIYF